MVRAREEQGRGKEGRWVLLSASAALLLFAAGPVPRSTAAIDDAERAALLAEPAPHLSVARLRAPLDPPRPRARRSVAGEVHCLDGPVPGLRILAPSADTPSGAVPVRASFADRRGRFRLPDPDPRARHLLALGAEGATITGPLLPVAEEERASMRWQLDWRLVRLRVLDAEGAPLVGRALRASSSPHAACFAVRHRTDAEGCYAVLVRGDDAVEVELLPDAAGAPQRRARFRAGEAEQIWRTETRGE